MEYHSLYQSKIGKIILKSDGKYLTSLCFTTSRFEEGKKIEKNKINDDLEIFKITKKYLDKYFNGEKVDFNQVPIKLNGTEFSLMVWDILKTISYGETCSYGDIANIISKNKNIKRMSSQAVGHAVGHNPICIIVPCHRVVGKDGNLVGYGEGIDKKQKLLKLEGNDMNKFYIPKKGNAL